MPTIRETEVELTVEAFYDKISRPNDLLLLDVRNEKDFETWRIEGRHTPDTLHIPYVIFVEAEEETSANVPPERDVVVLCAKGGASDYVAEILRGLGYRAQNLAGGMIAWGNYYKRRPVALMPQYEIYQFDRVARGCLSYVLISQDQAAVIDPARHTQQYLDFIAERGAQLVLVLDTHAHADHISGGPALAAETGAPYYLHPYDGIHPFDMLPARIEYEMLKDGLRLTLGDLQIETVHVPGHTLGLVNFLVTGSDGESYFFTGDSLFINSFGRPDLGGQGQGWAPLVYQSIFETIQQRVPGTAWLLPGHYARIEEARPNGVFAERLATVMHHNPDLQVGPDGFIEFVLTHLPTMPGQYIEIKRVNAGLSRPDEQEASELELGKNVCALSTAY